MRYRILYVEDNRIDFEMVKAVLEDHELLDTIYRVETKDEFLFNLQTKKIDLVLTDYSLPAFHGLEIVKMVTENFPEIPVIMVTGNLSDEIAVEIIKKGAWDYVLKENVYRLVPAIESSMHRLKMKQEKDQALETLKESENNYRSLAEFSPYGILVHLRGRVFYHNRQAIKILTEKDEGSLLGLKLINTVHPSYRDTLQERMEKIYRGEKVEGFHELKFLDPFGRELILEVASSPIFFKGYPAGQVMFRDIAERKKAEMELLEAKQKAEESDRLKTAFLENMSHEIRTPLNGIIGFATLLKQINISEEDKLSYIKIIEDSGKHLLSIINDLIEVSKIETGQIELRNEVFNLNELLEEIYVFFKDNDKYGTRPVELIQHRPLPDQQAAIYSDQGRLRQVLYNLINNAFKFTDQGRIEYGYSLKENGALEFFVKDSGTGIPPEAREMIFERFRQADNARVRSAGGNGLGLTICRGIIRAMKGRIWLESEIGKGTTFFFEFRFDRAIDEGTNIINSEVPDNRGFDWSDKTILIAEDEMSNFILLKEILQYTGVKIEHASNGKEVLNILIRNKNIDLILMDIKMPVLNGLDVVRGLRKMKNNIPVIAQTAFAMSEDEEKCMEAGCDDYITKPIKSMLLLEKINYFFHLQGE